MLSGLEDYLGTDALPPSPSSGEFDTETNASSGDSAELIPDQGSLRFISESQPKVSSARLMNLLSGKQQKKKAPRKTKKSPVSLNGADDIPSHAPVLDEEVVKAPLAVLDKSIQNTLKQEKIMALEKRIYSKAQSASAMDLLLKPLKCPLGQDPVVLSKTLNELSLLESKAGKSVTAKDLFLSLKRRITINKIGKWTLKVCLRISPDKLAAIKPQRITTRTSEKSIKVTIKLPLSALREIQRFLNPLFTKCSGHKSGKNARSVFAMMMKTASKNAPPKLTDLQKLNGLMPPAIHKDQMLITPEDHSSKRRSLTIDMPLRNPKPPTENTSQQKMKDFIGDANEPWRLDMFSFTPRRVDNSTLKELIAQNAPLASELEAHKRIIVQFIFDKPVDSSNLPWPQKFQPVNLDCLLTSEASRHFLKTWIHNSFTILKTQSTKTPRNVRKREQLRRQKRKQGAMADFIVNDFALDSDETEEEIFLPILIIQGEHGACKTSSVYAVMNALNGYVHEINSGQQRSRKDLHSSLKEFCTTQIIHKNHEEALFQDAIVLFEDCDVLFEQDRTFWTVVQDVINYSKRPIVLTVREDSVIPRSIWELAKEQDSIQTLEVDDREALLQYAWLCCFAHECIVSRKILSTLLDSSTTLTGFDVRKLLMACQLLCSGRKEAEGFYTEIERNTGFVNTWHSDKDILSAAHTLELVSASDVLMQNTRSSLLHEPVPNELLDICMVDQSQLLTHTTLPYELNIGREINQMTKIDLPRQGTKFMEFNDIRGKVLYFLRSREKALPKFLQDLQRNRAMTRNRGSDLIRDEPEYQGLPDTSTCYSMQQHLFLIDLAPVARDWAHFQKSLLILDSKRPTDADGGSLQDYLGWRMFYEGVEDVLNTI